MYVRTDVEEEEQGNDWLFTVIADIITAHNDMVELPRQVASQPFKRLLPQQQSTAYPGEIATANCIIPHFKMYVANKPPSIVSTLSQLYCACIKQDQAKVVLYRRAHSCLPNINIRTHLAA